MKTQRFWPLYVLLGAMWLYVLASSLATAQTSSLTQTLPSGQRLLLEFTVLVPLLVIWFVALHGALTLRRYARLIAGSPEARGLGAIADGLFWLIAYLIFTSVFGAIIQTLAHHQSVQLLVSFKNHALVAMGFIGSALLYYGSTQLRRAVYFTTWNQAALWLFALFCIGAAVFTWMFTWSTVSTDRNGVPLYALPKPTLAFSLILPYILPWFMSLLAGLNIGRYAATVKGPIYRQALRRLVWGLVALTALSITLQVLTLAAIVVSGLSLTLTLLLVYILLLFYGWAFWLVQAGARQLTQLEAVS